MAEETGGVIRLLWAAMGYPMVWPIDGADTTLLSERTARKLATLALVLTGLGAMGWVGAFRG